MNLSPALSELLGETSVRIISFFLHLGGHKIPPPSLSQALTEYRQLSRPQCVKKIWAYVKERELQDPADKRQIRCDDALRAVFKQDRVHMFTMNKILNQNLYAMDEVA
jgi:chromatin remodeling complex protein RSC6